MGILERIRDPRDGVAPSLLGVAPKLPLLSDSAAWRAGVSRTNLRNCELFMAFIVAQTVWISKVVVELSSKYGEADVARLYYPESTISLAQKASHHTTAVRFEDEKLEKETIYSSDRQQITQS